MKKLIIAVGLMLIASAATFAQNEKTEEITHKNSWLKLGVDLGVPVGDVSNVSSFMAGLELKGQLMETNHLGIGLTTGYNNFFPKSGFDNFGTIPLGAFIRAYPKSSGFFAGLDAGYSFITVANADGGFYLKPQLGYHNYDWNVFAYYNGIFRSDSDGGNIQDVGIGATYNIRFK